MRRRAGVVLAAALAAGGLAAVAGGGAARAATTTINNPSPSTVNGQSTAYGPAGTDDGRTADSTATLAGTADFTGSASSNIYYFVTAGPDANESGLCTAGAAQSTATGTSSYSCPVGHTTGLGTDFVTIYATATAQPTPPGPPPSGAPTNTNGKVNWADVPVRVAQKPGTYNDPQGTCNAFQVTVSDGGATPNPLAPVDVLVTPLQGAPQATFCDPTAGNNPGNPQTAVGPNPPFVHPQTPAANTPGVACTPGGANTPGSVPSGGGLLGEFCADGNGVVTFGVLGGTGAGAQGSYEVDAFVETVASLGNADNGEKVVCSNATGTVTPAAPTGQANGDAAPNPPQTAGLGNNQTATSQPGTATCFPFSSSSNVVTAGSPNGVGGIAASPANATNVTGQPHTVNALVCSVGVNGSANPPTCATGGQPIPGAPVTETIPPTSVNGPATIQCVTDQRGIAPCTYTGGSNTGTDVLNFSTPAANNTTKTTSASKTWVTGALALDADGGNDIPSQTTGCDQNADPSASFNSGAIRHVCAKVTQGGNPPQGFSPVSNQTVAFTTTGIGGLVDCTSGNPTSSQSPSVNTDANGYAQVCVGSQFGGQQTVGASVGNGGTGKTGSVSITWTGPTATTTSTTSTTISTTTTTTPSGPQQGYTEVASDGGIFAFGKAAFFGSTGNIKLNKPIVGMTWTRSGKGYYLVASDGGIFAFGDAAFLGSTGSTRLNSPVVGMRVTPSGKGYYLVASDGGIFSFGDATFRGSTGAIKLNKPIVGLAVTPSGQGYWLAASDGGIFAFGDAPFLGSTGNIKLNSPVVGMAATSTGKGYWFVASDGGIFNFGDAAFFGSTGAIKLNKPIVAMIATPTDKGYWLVASDGGIFAFGDATFQGSMGGRPLNSPIVGGDAPSS